METIKRPEIRLQGPAVPEKKEIIPDNQYLVGLFLLVVNLGVLLVTKESNDEMVAIITQSISVVYVIFLFLNSKMKVFWKKQPIESLPHRLLAWQIWIISCFTLNRAISIFQESTDWLVAALVVWCLGNILFYWEAQLPKRLREGLYIILAFSAVLWSYFTVYTCVFYPVGLIGILIFGLGFHIYIPLFILVAHVKLLIRAWRTHNNAILFGVLTPIVFTIVFAVQWNMSQTKIQAAYQKSFTSKNDEIPNWVATAQKIEKNWITERILKSELLYQNFEGDFDFMPRTRNFEKVEHDPLVMIASFFSRKNTIDIEEKIKILEVMQDTRHESEERLWAGNKLITQDVITQARIYPEYRIAYTEKTLSIANQSIGSWRNQEVIYTFYMPEGSVASSLSLWINGREEKAYLTTKAKADSAYKTIVGVESRDPSVIHWHEGNTLSVRVFPCTSREVRRVKIGITSPLKESKGELVYENIYFKGPDANDAKETVKIDFSQPVEGLTSPWNTNSLSIEDNGHYKPYWQLSFKTPQLSKKTFSFQGKSYALLPLVIPKKAFNPANIYLDINAEWSKSEFDNLYSAFKNKPLWVWKDGLVQLNEHNKDNLFYELKENQFSLFPIYKIHPQNLFITKGTLKAPNLTDLDGSGFAKSIRNIDNGQEHIQVLSLNETLSPYLKTLKELGAIAVNEVDLDKIKTGQLFKILRSADRTSVNIENAKMQIREVSGLSEKTDAPDHLLRLYAYNHIMQQIGASYFTKDYLLDSLIQEASIANIVTPISSLIVLETKADYERFDISKNHDSLQNATLKSSGSVPEPHEWVLIITFACFVLYFILKKIL